MYVPVSEPRFHQARGPSPEVSHGQKAVLYVPETIPERQNPCGRHTPPSSSPNSLAIIPGVQAETIQGNVGCSSKMPLRGDNVLAKWFPDVVYEGEESGEFLHYSLGFEN